ncbi:MAG: tail fiber domain-containing protein, partial [Halobacteriaceae archaeon]
MPGSIIFDGTENDSIPASGAGTRLMWYPAKAAFRAGRVGFDKDGTQWDAPKVGRYSAAFGIDTKADGYSATAIGSQTTASGFAATAMGFETTASASASTAMGDETIASGQRATAMGRVTTASGFAATAIGEGTTAASSRSLSIGECNSANTLAGNTLFVAGNGNYDFQSEACGTRSDALILYTGGSLTISGTLTESSDRRLKKEISSLGSDVLWRLSQLRPVRFEFKNQETHPPGRQIGLLAQDVQNEFPALVSEGTGGYLSLSYSKLTAVLLKGIQEQQANVEQQQATIDSLKEKVQQIQKVKKRLASLEAERSPSTIAGMTSSRGGLLLSFLI